MNLFYYDIAQAVVSDNRPTFLYRPAEDLQYRAENLLGVCGRHGLTTQGGRLSVGQHVRDEMSHGLGALHHVAKKPFRVLIEFGGNMFSSTGDK